MGPTSYCLGPMLYSSSDVSRIVRNDIRPHNYSNRGLGNKATSIVLLKLILVMEGNIRHNMLMSCNYVSGTKFAKLKFAKSPSC